MWNILFFFAAGVVSGWIIRKRSHLVKAAGLGTSILLGGLIFMLGVSAGSHPDVVKNFSQLGLTAIALALGGMAGSILFLSPLSHRWSKKTE